MIDKLLFKKVELWLVLLIVKILIIVSLLFGSLVFVHTTNPQRFPVLGNFSKQIAKFPISIYKVLMNVTSFPNGLAVEEKRFGEKAGEIFNKDVITNQIVVVPHVCSDDKGWCLSLFDLMTHEKHIITDLNQIMRDLTKKISPKFYDYTRGASNVIGAPRFDHDGNLYFLTNSGLFVKLGPDMKVRWAKDNLFYHHTFNFTNDGDFIWAIGNSKKNCEIYPNFNYDILINDCIIQLDKVSGDVISVHSITNAMIDANLHNHLFVGRIDKSLEDPLHINDVQPVNLESIHFSKGDVFISLGHANMVLLYDTLERKIKWNITDSLFHQHDVDILDDSKIAIFNNNRVFTDKDKTFKHNEVLKYDFSSGKTSNLFQDVMRNHDLRTVSQGLFEISGDTFFVEETNYGRVVLFYKKDLVFEYYSKNKGGYSQNLGWSYVETNPMVLEELRKRFFK